MDKREKMKRYKIDTPLKRKLMVESVGKGGLRI